MQRIVRRHDPATARQRFGRLIATPSTFEKGLIEEIDAGLSAGRIHVTRTLWTIDDRRRDARKDIAAQELVLDLSVEESTALSIDILQALTVLAEHRVSENKED